MGTIYTSVEQLIGGTPLLELRQIQRAEGLNATLLAKLEYLNPAGSAKDRVAKAMLDDAEAKGLLKPGAVIIEPTSGNTGIGLAVVAATRGYRTIIVMPDTMSMERRLLMSAYGAELVLTRAPKGWQAPLQKRRNWPGRFPTPSSPGSLTTPPTPTLTGPPPARKSGRIPTDRWTFSSPGWAPAAPSPAQGNTSRPKIPT